MIYNIYFTPHLLHHGLSYGLETIEVLTLTRTRRQRKPVQLPKSWHRSIRMLSNGY